MNPIAILKSLLNAPTATLKATELLTIAFTGRVLPAPDKPQETSHDHPGTH